MVVMTNSAVKNRIHSKVLCGVRVDDSRLHLTMAKIRTKAITALRAIARVQFGHIPMIEIEPIAKARHAIPKAM